MTYENINFSKDFFSTKNGYFYYIEESSGVLCKKVCDGGMAFTYPIVENVGFNPIKYMHYDGYYFWTLQDGSTGNDIDIKRWYISDYFCRLRDTVLSLEHTDLYDYNIDTFTLEHYNTTLSGGVNKGDSSLSISDYCSEVESGDELLLGPNYDGKCENVTVTGTLENPNELGLNFFIQNNYEDGDNVVFSKNIWLINKYFDDSLEASLLKYSILDEELTNVFQDLSFKDVISSCYYLKNNTPYILFVVDTNLRFLNLKSIETEKTMTLDNLELDQSTVIPITAIQVENDTLYRLQNKAVYYEKSYGFSTYNYQPSPIRPFIDSVSIDAYPKILPSNGMNVAEINMVVNDQFASKMAFRPVEFFDTDSIGFITVPKVYTNLEGVATSYYKAGIVPQVVTIVGIATQYN